MNTKNKVNTAKHNIQGDPKIGTNSLYASTVILTDFQNYSTLRIRRKFVIIHSLKIPPHLKCVATLPCEMSAFHWSRH